ncbi:MAG: polysaccharide biosynthesis tyrosine autokinase [Balneolaceae bacterium]|nr:polysaccharide biosynthesis tyrosine autokinase [Balneolaceae bacterium]
MSDSIQKRDDFNITNGRDRIDFIPDYNYGKSESQSNTLNPKEIVALLFRYKWLIMVFLIAGGTAAWFYADSVTPVYESTGTMMISSADETVNDELSQIISQTTGVGTRATIENELQVLQSRRFSRLIAKELMSNETGDINEYPLLWGVTETGTEYKVSEETAAGRIRNNLDFTKVAQDADVVQISFQSPSPTEAAKVVNLAMEIYVENSTQQNREAAKKTAEFLEQEKQEIKQKLEASEQRLRQYMDTTGIVRVDEQASGIVNKRVETDTELQRVELELKTVNETISNYEDQLERIKPGLADQISEAVGPRIQNSQQRLAAFERERTLIIAKNPGVQERNPVPARLKYVNEQIAQLKSDIKELSAKLFTEEEFIGMDTEDRARLVSDIQGRLVDLRVQKNQLQSRKEALNQLKNEIDNNFNNLPEGMMELAKLQRDVRINEELYLNVSRQFADMSVWKESQFGFGRIIDHGLKPGSPVSPNKKLLLIMGIMVAGFLAAGFIFIKEVMDNSVKNVDTLKNRYLPSMSLSMVPTFENVADQRKYFKVGEGKIPKEMVLLKDRTNLASEAIRRLKNNIIYQNGDTPPRTIAITSPEKGDGKSTIVANLGMAFAEEGYRTLVIDADFRRPKIHTCFGLQDSAGLSDYVNGKIPYQDILMDTDMETLKVITAGREIDKPEVIGSSMIFKQFIKKMQEVFDVILIDTPPFGIISDSSALLKLSESTILVARYRKTNRTLLLRTLEDLRRIGVKVTDIVLNDFDYRKEAGNYYGSGYHEAMYSNYEAYIK